MGGNMLTDNRTHGGIGVTRHKHTKPRVKVGAYVTKMFPPSLALGERHLFGSTSGCLGITVGSMEIEIIH